MHRDIRRALTAALLILSAGVGYAQERPSEFANYVIPGWSFTPGISLSGMWDSNVSLSAPEAELGRTLGDNLFVIVPSAQVSLLSARTTFDAGYRGYLRRYQDVGHLNGFDQRAYAGFKHALTPRLNLSIADEFSRLPTTDLLWVYGVPFRRLGAKTNQFATELDARLTKYVDFGIRYENTWAAFDRVDEFINGGTIHGFSANVKRRLSERATVGVEGRIRRSDVTRIVPRIAWFRDAGATFAYRLTEFLTLNLAGGFSYVREDFGNTTRTSPYYRIGLQHGMERVTMGVTLEQSYTPTFSLGGSNNNRELRGFVNMPFGRNRFYVQADASWRRWDRTSVTDVQFDTVITQAVVGYSALRWLRMEAYHAYSRQDSIIPGAPIQRHRIGTQVVVSQPMRIR